MAPLSFQRGTLIHPDAGRPAPGNGLINPAALERAYLAEHPDPADPQQRVNFSSSGHRGTPTANSFNQDHVIAITQAICDYRQTRATRGPLYLGKDTHALSAAAQRTALEVLAANDVLAVIQCGDGATPTPVISRAIVTYNRGRLANLADGIVISPCHNPPEHGGIKYNAPHGGPPDSAVTAWIESRANDILRLGPHHVKRATYPNALWNSSTRQQDLVTPYVHELCSVIDLGAVRNARLKIGVDALGGASLAYWEAINDTYHLDIEIVNAAVDPAFSFMTLDHDGRIRMDCASPCAMVRLVDLRGRFDVAFANDPDADRCGIVTPGAGLMNPSAFLAVAIDYLLTHRPGWPDHAAVGKSLFSSSIIDRIVKRLAHPLRETPGGFEHIAPTLADGSCCFAGDECAGASFLRLDGTTWTTDKDGILMALLAAEITARTGQNPAQHFERVTREFGTPHCTRIGLPASPEQKAQLRGLDPQRLNAASLAGHPILATLTRAPGNNAPIGGVKVVTASGWFAARPSPTEDLYTIEAESFKSDAHLQDLVNEAHEMISAALAAAQPADVANS